MSTPTNSFSVLVSSCQSELIANLLLIYIYFLPWCQLMWWPRFWEPTFLFPNCFFFFIIPLSLPLSLSLCLPCESFSCMFLSFPPCHHQPVTPKETIHNQPESNCYHHHNPHQGMLTAEISLTVSCHLSLPATMFCKFSWWHPVSEQNWRTSQPTLNSQSKMLLISLSLLFQEFSACLVYLTWMFLWWEVSDHAAAVLLGITPWIFQNSN